MSHNLIFNLRYMMVLWVKRLWSYKGRKVGHLSLAVLQSYRENQVCSPVLMNIFLKSFVRDNSVLELFRYVAQIDSVMKWVSAQHAMIMFKGTTSCMNTRSRIYLHSYFKRWRQKNRDQTTSQPETQYQLSLISLRELSQITFALRGG